jgi:hypothetical protein
MTTPQPLEGARSNDMSGLTREQYDFLADGLNPSRVSQFKGNAHLEAWDVRRHLIRIFGFGGFDIETKSHDLCAQIEHPPKDPGSDGPNGKPRWTVVYRAEVRLIVKDPTGREVAHFDDGATGDSQNQPSLGDAHDQALKTALSQALKRCAVNLGDQFGLSLYNNGRPNPVVNRSLVVPDGTASPGEMAQVAAQDEPVGPAVEQPADADATATPPRQRNGSRDEVIDKAHAAIASATTVETLGQIRNLVDKRALDNVLTTDDALSLHAAINGREAELTGNHVAPQPIGVQQRAELFALFAEMGMAERGKQVEFLNRVTGRELGSRNDLTATEADKAIAALRTQQRQGAGKNGRSAVAA